MEKFINQYSISKTLRFELRPQGKTQEYFEQAKILERDIKRSDDYREAKQIIDKYHKFYMEQKLSNAQLDKEQLHALKTLLTSSDSDVKKIATQQERLRKYVVKILEEKPKEGENIAVFKDIFKKELIQEILPKWEELNEKERSIIEGFNKFTTYFTGFHENRKNIYTSEEKSTSIAYRLIHDNFPKFLDNIRAYEKICKDYPELARQLTQHAGDDFFQLEYYNQCLSQYGIEHYNVVIDGFTTGTEKQKQQGLNEYINQYKHQTGDKRIPSFKPLFKQILSDRVSLSFLLDAFECDKDLASAVCTTYLRLQQDKILEKLQKLLQQLATNYQGGCYVNHQLFSRLSQELTGDWGYIYRALGHMYDSQYLPKTKKITKKYEKEREKFTKQDISLKQSQ